MSAREPHVSEGWVCRKCAGANGVHWLTCPTLRLPQDVPLFDNEEASV